jgi:hypothetical protein
MSRLQERVEAFATSLCENVRWGRQVNPLPRKNFHPGRARSNTLELREMRVEIERKTARG